MIFQAHAKGLRLVVQAGRKEVDKSAGIPVMVDHPQKEIRFSNWRYETEDPAEIEWLKRHRMFSEVPSLPGRFWEFIAPPDPTKIIAEKDARIAELEAELASKKEPTAPVPEEPETKKEEEKKPAEPPTGKKKCEGCGLAGTIHKADCPFGPIQKEKVTS